MSDNELNLLNKKISYYENSDSGWINDDEKVEEYLELVNSKISLLCGYNPFKEDNASEEKKNEVQNTKADHSILIFCAVIYFIIFLCVYFFDDSGYTFLEALYTSALIMLISYFIGRLCTC